MRWVLGENSINTPYEYRDLVTQLIEIVEQGIFRSLEDFNWLSKLLMVQEAAGKS
jgi:hypothetical protein